MGTEGVGKVLEERRKEKHKFIYTKKKQSCVAQHFLALCIYIYEAYEGTDIRPHFGWSRLQLIKGEARGGEDSPEVSGYNGTWNWITLSLRYFRAYFSPTLLQFLPELGLFCTSKRIKMIKQCQHYYACSAQYFFFDESTVVFSFSCKCSCK